MKRSILATTGLVFIPAVFAWTSCASTTEQAQSVRNVDDLLTHIERVQVDATVAKDKAHEALVQLRTLVMPNFTGDATKAYGALKVAIESSEKQTQTLQSDIAPMVESADEVFHRWMGDLEGFGNSRLRERSQTRLDETRARYQAVLMSAQSAILSFQSFNADLRDQALFLANDLNAAAVASILPDVRALHEQIHGLDARVDACSAAARAYVETSALHGQVEVVVTEAPPAETTTEQPVKTTFSKRRTTTLKPRPSEPVAPAPETIPSTEPEAAQPAPQSTPEPKPVTGPGTQPR